jgi:NAD(P)-dependent dehydrogenase (short-subunit alcohol dehydrogenase family)
VGGRARLDARHAGAGDRIRAIPAELGDPEGCRAAVEEARRRFGRVEAVVNNAGIGVSSLRPDGERNLPTIEELSAEIWDRFFAVNVRAPMLVAQAALPDMKRGGWGRIVNNTTSYLTMLRVLPYGATKSALESMSAIWAKELDGTGITVNVLVPGGPTDTPFVSDASGIPRDRMLRPEVMGPPLRWLVSEASAGFTGRRIVAGRWDAALEPEAALAEAARPAGWPELTHDVIWPAT